MRKAALIIEAITLKFDPTLNSIEGIAAEELSIRTGCEKRRHINLFKIVFLLFFSLFYDDIMFCF